MFVTFLVVMTSLLYSYSTTYKIVNFEGKQKVDGWWILNLGLILDSSCFMLIHAYSFIHAYSILELKTFLLAYDYHEWTSNRHFIIHYIYLFS